MVSVCLLSDALSQHLPSYLGFSYLGHRVSLHGCSSKVQPLLLTLDKGYLLTTTRPDLEPYMYYCGLRQSNFSSLGSGRKAANRPGSVDWKFDFASYWFMYFVLTFLEFSRGCSAAEPRTHVFAVHSGAWPVTLHPSGLARKFQRIFCWWGRTKYEAPKNSVANDTDHEEG